MPGASARARLGRGIRAAHSEEAGVSYVTVIGALFTLISVGVFTIDAGFIWVARTQLQAAADAAALAGASDLVDPTATTVTLGAAQAAAVAYAGLNQSAHNAVTVDPADLVYGNWDVESRVLDTSADLTEPDQVTAIRVTARMDDSTNARLPVTFAKLFGRTGFNIAVDATGYLGWAGSAPVGEIPIPIAIDCCELRGSPDCDQDYCTTITSNPPNPCSVTNVQSGAPSTVSCLDFAPTEDQNACWTNLSQSSGIVSTTVMRDILEDGNSEELDIRSNIYLDNGTKTAVVNTISDRFYGSGSWNSSTRSGTDRYPPFDGQSDSWVVTMPVVECQDETHCATGDNSRITGFVCFEVREINGAPNKLIKGRFLCPGDPLIQDEGCQIGGGTGGDPFGVRAQSPVLVD